MLITSPPIIAISDEGSLQGSVSKLDFAGVNVVASISAGVATVTVGSVLTIGTTTIASGTSTRVLYDNGGLLGESANFTFDGSLITVTSSGLGVTPNNTMGLVLYNATAASVGAQQISGILRFRGNGWHTSAGGGSFTSDFRIYNLPVQGGINVGSSLVFDSSGNGGAYTTALTLSTNNGGVFTGAVTTPYAYITTGVMLGNGATTSTNSVQLLTQASFTTWNWNWPTGPGTTGQPLLSSGAGTTAMTFGTLGFVGGGTGATSFTNHGVVVAGATALATVAPSTAGNVLTSDGTDWTSAAPSAGGGVDVITGKVIYVDGSAVNATDSRSGLSKYDKTYPYATIQGAISDMDTEDTLYIMPGSYTEDVARGSMDGVRNITYFNVTQTGSLNLEGSGEVGDNLTIRLINSTIDGNGASTAVTLATFDTINIYGDIPPNTDGSKASTLKGSEVTLVVTGLVGSKTLSIKNIAFFPTNIKGISATDLLALNLENVYIDAGSTGEAAIYVYGGTILTIKNSIIQSGKGYCILLENNFLPSQLKLYNNYFGAADKNEIIYVASTQDSSDAGTCSIVGNRMSWGANDGEGVLNFTSSGAYDYNLYFQSNVVDTNHICLIVPDIAAATIDLYHNRAGKNLIAVPSNATVRDYENIIDVDTKAFKF